MFRILNKPAQQSTTPTHCIEYAAKGDFHRFLRCVIKSEQQQVTAQQPQSEPAPSASPKPGT